ncbi:MAG: YraN family protein [Haliscomenobacter sp.]|nr:YraN family protein [Haliscomenobacter sp.]MBK8880671.1 YraN family protein [Haliscomenobacter sp.]
MASKHELGKRGEDIAAQYLLDKGYRILERNWRYKRAEVDLIAQEAEVLVFVEVKTRASERFGAPENFVGRRKQAFLASAASFFCDQNAHAGEVRFDVISILFSGKDFHTAHLPDAFFPGLG